MQEISHRSLTFDENPNACIQETIGVPDALGAEKTALAANFSIYTHLSDYGAVEHFHEGTCVQNGYTVMNGDPQRSQVGDYVIDAQAYFKPATVIILL